MPITKNTAFFDVGVCGPIIFGITFVITYFKLCFQSKLLGKGILEAFRTKKSCLHLMVIPHLNPFENLVEVESKLIFACQKMMINRVESYGTA